MRGNKTMDHTAVVRQKMTERYLLDELDPEVRDEFEEHYFDCPECALDIRAGAQFVAHSKTVLAESSEPTPARAIPNRSRRRIGLPGCVRHLPPRHSRFCWRWLDIRIWLPIQDFNPNSTDLRFCRRLL